MDNPQRATSAVAQIGPMLGISANRRLLKGPV
jgi:hypothetical protein